MMGATYSSSLLLELLGGGGVAALQEAREPKMLVVSLRVVFRPMVCRFEGDVPPLVDGEVTAEGDVPPLDDGEIPAADVEFEI
jgi:hypothetical protein